MILAMTPLRRDALALASRWVLTPVAAALTAIIAQSAFAASDSNDVDSNAGLSVYAAQEAAETYPPTAPAKPVTGSVTTTNTSAEPAEAPAPDAGDANAPVVTATAAPTAAANAATAAPAAATPATSTAKPAAPHKTKKPLAKGKTTNASAEAASSKRDHNTNPVTQEPEPALPEQPSTTLPSIDTVGERLGWMSAAEIAKMPDVERTHALSVCGGQWVTPIAANVPQTDLSKEDVLALANSVTYQADGSAEFNGQVRIKQTSRMLEADSGTITQNRGYGRFDGNVRIAEPGILLTGEQALVNIDTSAAQLTNSEFVSSVINAHGRAERMRRFDDGVISIDRGIYTTCAPGNRVWSFEANDIELNQNTGVGKVYDAKLRIEDVPVFYFPYFKFPIDDRPESGILVPRFGSTTSGGFDLAVPLYLSLAPNYDVTLTPRELSNRGTMLNGNFRFLTENFGKGFIDVADLPDDQITGTDRKRFSIRDTADWQNGWTARTEYNYVSDSNYFTDLGTYQQNAVNTTQQERVAETRYSTDKYSILGRVQSYQTLDPGILDADRPYSRLPQLLFTTEPARLPGWQPGMRAEVAAFERNIGDGSAPEVNGTRMRLDPQLAYDYSQPWGYIKPTIRVTQLNYALTGSGVTGNSSPTLTVPTLSWDQGLYFQRVSDDGSTQSIEPRLLYLYAPNHNQNALPNFDTVNTTFDYDQLFRTTRFSGNDRIDDANQLSLGVTTRLQNSQGIENLTASAGQILYFRNRDVQLPVTGSTVVPIATAATSAYAGSITGRVNEELTAFADVLMDPDTHSLTEYGAAFTYLPLNYKSTLNAGYRFRAEDPTIGQKSVSETLISFVQPLTVNWKLIGLWQYDFKSSQSLEATFGVSYESCCWEFRVYKRSYLSETSTLANAPNPELHNSAVFFEITLKGLARMHSGINALLQNNIFGYTQVHQNEEKY